VSWKRCTDVSPGVLSAWKMRAPLCTAEVWSSRRGEWFGKLKLDGQTYEWVPLAAKTLADAKREVIDSALETFGTTISQLKACH